MNVDQTSVAAVFQGLKAAFTDALAKLEPQALDEIIVRVPSQSGSENYPVATLLGDLELVVDEVTLTNIGRWLQNVENLTFARAVQVRRNDIADDNIGLYGPAVQGLARRAGNYHYRLAAQALTGGFTTLWGLPPGIDGANVYSAAHTWVGGLAWSNLGAPAALGPIPFNAACTALETRTGPDGAPLGLTATHLVVGPQLRAAAEAIVQTQLILGSTNIFYQRARLVVVPRMGASTAWFVVDAGGVKPMVLQDREGPEFTERTDPTQEDAFYREMFAFKGRRRCNVAILAPWLIQANAGV